MDILFQQLRNFPLIALFLSLGIGFILGKFKVKKFVLGGIIGTLITAVIIGQVGGIHVSESIKDMFFSLFIFMIGYLGGPQFFSALKPASFKYLGAAVAMTVLGLFAVLGLSIWAGLDKGLAAGLAAGGLTQSVIIGTAGNAIDQLGLAAAAAQEIKTNLAVGYSITYIFGAIGPILMISIVPLIMKWDIRKEAIKLAAKIGGVKELDDGEFEPIKRVDTRFYRVTKTSKFINDSVSSFENEFNSEISVELLVKGKEKLEPEPTTIFQENDVVFISGLVSSISKIGSNLGEEVSEFGVDVDFIEEVRSVILTNKKIANITLAEAKKKLSMQDKYGVFISGIIRATRPLPVLEGTVIYKGDEIILTGKKKDLDRIEKILGYKAPSVNATEFATLGFGMVLGYLIGEISFDINGIPVTLGAGLGCLLSGLIVGFLRTRHPKLGGINTGAAHFLQTFGLAVFVGIVGLNAGEPALQAIKQYGLTLLFLGVVVTMVPMTVQFFLNYYLFKIKNPIEALGVLMGSRSANPGLLTLLDKAGNSTPVPTFTMTYAVANIFAALWGPVIIAII